MAIEFNVNGNTKTASDIFCKINGAKRRIISVLTSENGVLKVIYQKNQPHITTGYVFIANDGYTIVITENFTNYEVIFSSEVPLVSLIYANGSFYAYQGNKQIVSPASEFKCFISTNLETWEEHSQSYIYDSTYPLYQYHGVSYYNGLFYKLMYWTKSTTPNRGRTIYVATSTNGYEWDCTKTNLGSLVGYYDNSYAQVSAWGIIHNENYSYIVAYAYYQPRTGYSGKVYGAPLSAMQTFSAGTSYNYPISICILQSEDNARFTRDTKRINATILASGSISFSSVVSMSGYEHLYSQGHYYGYINSVSSSTSFTKLYVDEVEVGSIELTYTMPSIPPSPILMRKKDGGIHIFFTNPSLEGANHYTLDQYGTITNCGVCEYIPRESTHDFDMTYAYKEE